MSLFNVIPLTSDERVNSVVRISQAQANDTYKRDLQRYNLQYDTAWHNANLTSIAEAQLYLDRLGPGEAARAFAASYQLALYLNTVSPNSIPAERIAPPIAYTTEPIEITPATTDIDDTVIPAVMGVRIVLDPNATYPGPLAS